MRPGVALEQTWVGTADFPGPGQPVVTLSPGGPGRLVSCLKCHTCGHSVTAIADSNPAQTGIADSAQPLGEVGGVGVVVPLEGLQAAVPGERCELQDVAEDFACFGRGGVASIMETQPGEPGLRPQLAEPQAKNVLLDREHFLPLRDGRPLEEWLEDLYRS